MTGVAGAVVNTVLRHETNQDMNEYLIDIASDSYSFLGVSAEQTMAQNTNKSDEAINPFFAQLMDDHDEGFIAPETDNIAKNSVNNKEKMNPFFA